MSFTVVDSHGGVIHWLLCRLGGLQQEVILLPFGRVHEVCLHRLRIMPPDAASALSVDRVWPWTRAEAAAKGLECMESTWRTNAA